MTLLLLAVLLALAFARPVLADEGAGDASAWLPAGLAELVEQAPMTMEEFFSMKPGQALASLWETFVQVSTGYLRLFVRISLILALTAAVAAPAGDSGFLPLLELTTFLACAGVCIPPLASLLTAAGDSIFACKNMLLGAVPLMASLLAGGGQPAAAGVFSGFFLTCVLLLAQLSVDLILPLARCALALHAAAGVGELPMIPAAAQMMQRLAAWVLGLTSSIFGLLLGVQNILAAASDGFALKTGKFLISSSVPIVGQAVSGALGAVTAGMRMARGMAGFAVLCAVGAAFLPVMAQSLVCWTAFSAAGVAARTLNCGRCAALLKGAAGCAGLCGLTLLFYAFLNATAMLGIMLTGGA